MNKSELVSSVSATSGLTKVDSEKAIEAVFEAISHALKVGDDVRLIGFGTFSVAVRAATEGRNPRTGLKISIPERKVPRFRPGKQLKELVEHK